MIEKSKDRIKMSKIISVSIIGVGACGGRDFRFFGMEGELKLYEIEIKYSSRIYGRTYRLENR